MCSDRPESLTLLAVLPEYLQHLRTAGRSRHTVASTELDLRQLAEFLRSQDLRTTSSADLQAFFLWLRRQHRNRVSSLRRKTSTVKRFFQFLRGSGLIAADPSAPLRYPAPEPRWPRVLTPQESDAILAAAGAPAWTALIGCLLDCGLKRDEAAALRWEDVDLAAPVGHGLLHVRRRQASQRVRRRTLPLTKRLATALAQHREASEDAPLVFGISPRGIDFIVETAARRAGLRPEEKVTPQMLRDAFACRRAAELIRREQAASDDPARRVELAREHDLVLLRELGLSDASAAAARYRRMVEGMQADRPEGVGLLDP